VIEASEHSLRTYIADAVASGHFLQSFGQHEFTYGALQRQLHKDGFGSAAKNTKEVGEALKAAGVGKVRRSVEAKKLRLYRLPEPQEDAGAAAEPLDF
jgi:hypothetical protein